MRARIYAVLNKETGEKVNHYLNREKAYAEAEKLGEGYIVISKFRSF